MAPKAADAKHNSQAVAKDANSSQLKKTGSGKKLTPDSKSGDKAVKKASAGAVEPSATNQSQASKGTSVPEYDELEYVEKLPEDDLDAKLAKEEEEMVIKPTKISMQLVAIKALGKEKAAAMGAEAVADAVFKLESVQLDSENIAEIDNLEGLGNVTHLYLQRNRITQIQNLESLMTLRLLSLASNLIEKVENLTCLPNLKALDLGYNKIEKVEPSDFPLSLMFLTTDGNPLSEMNDDKWSDVYDYLPDLRQHDCEDIGIVDSDDENVETTAAGNEDRDREDEDDHGEFDEEQSTEATRMLLEKIMMGREQLIAAAKMFDDSMEELRQKRRDMVEKHLEEMRQDRMEEEKRYDEAEKAVEEMKARLRELPENTGTAALQAEHEDVSTQASGGKKMEAIDEEAGAKEDVYGPD